MTDGVNIDLKFGVKGSNEAKTAARGVEQVIEELARALGLVGNVAKESVRAITGEYSDAEAAIDKTTQAQRRFNQEAAKSDDVSAPTARRGGGGGGIGIGDAVDGGASSASQLLGGLGQGEAANFAGLAADAASALTSLNPAVIALTVAGVGLAAVIGNIAQRMAEASAAGEEYATELIRQVNLVNSDATTADVQAATDQDQLLLNAINQTIASPQGLLDRFALNQRAIVDDVTRVNAGGEDTGIAARRQNANEAIIEQLRALVPSLSGTASEGEVVTAVNALITALKTEANPLSARIDGNQALLDTGAFAANDAAAAAEEAAARAEAELVQRIAVRETALRAVADAETLSSEALNDRLAAIQTDQDVLRTLREEEGLSTEQRQAYTDQLQLLAVEERNLANVVRPLVEAREEEARAIEATTKAIDFRKRVLAQANQADDALDRAGDLSVDALKDLEAAAGAFAKAEIDGRKALESIEQDAADRRADLVQRGEDKKLDILTNAQEAVERIQKEFTRSYTSAVGERDALAAFEAAQRQKDELDEARKGSDKALSQQARDEQRALEQANAAASKARAAQRESNAEELRSRQQAYQAARTIFDSAKRDELNAAQTYQQLLAKINQDGAAAALQVQNNFWSAAVNIGTREIARLRGNASVFGNGTTTRAVNRMVDNRVLSYLEN